LNESYTHLTTAGSESLTVTQRLMFLFISSLLITLAVQIQASLVVFTPPILAPVAEADVGINAAAVGLVTALIYLTSVPSAFFSGIVIEKLGAIRVSQLCVLCASIGVSLMATGNVVAIVFGALIVGLGYGAVTPSSSTVLADRAPEHLRSLIFSIKQSGVPIGGAIAGALVPLMIHLYGWKIAALAIGVIGLIVIVIAQPIRARLDQGMRAGSDGVEKISLIHPLKLVMSHSKLRELAISSFAFSGVQMSLGSYLVVMLIERAQLSVSVAGSALSIAMIAGIGGRLFWGVLADYGFSARTVLGFLGLLMGISAFSVGLIDEGLSIVFVYIFAFIFGASAIGWNGVYLAEVARIAPKGQAGTATGASLAMTYSGVVIFPSIFWMIHHFTSSYVVGFLTLGLIALWRGFLFFRKMSMD